ncbi:MAG TPA: hypothetical protein VGE18_03445 [Candidatus Paceibacterota bacterium]
MLVIVVSDTKTFRKECIAPFCSAENETVLLDDTLSSLIDLEQYLYPSLFNTGTPVVHAQFMLENRSADMTAVFVKRLAASPTVFIFEEFALPAPLLTQLKKHGAVVHAHSAPKAFKKGPDLFALASAIITPNKKDAWMNYQKALSLQPIEALLGIMYWKVRDMMMKTRKEEYKTLYENMLRAHAKAWQTNTPLELMIEKVLLQ